MSLQEEARLLADRLHADPHRVLGLHEQDGGWVARAWRPEAAWVSLVPDHGDAMPMERADDLGLFCASLPGEPGRYLVETKWPDGGLELDRDAYTFLPTLGELDLYLVGEGSHRALWERLGAHRRTMEGVVGTAFAVWAPNARGVSVVGDFNHWDGRRHPMRSLGASGIWELFLPGVGTGAAYKFEVRSQDGHLLQKADPMAQWAEERPRTASRVHASRHAWADAAWMEARPARRPHREPVSIYEVHLPSWRRRPEEGHRPLGYRELAEELSDYVTDMGFTHVEFMPVTEHPFDGSWGYQTTGYYAATSRMGEPDDLRHLVDALHRNGVGVILDWAPAHFPKDEWALARFDGTPLYEHADPLRGEHPDWGTLVFNHGRTEVRNFLVASGLFWLREFHVDGLRVDAVASMLYRDYSRKEGQWVPGPHGEREDRDAIAFLQELNAIAHAEEPGVLVAAEESTAWPGVTRMVDQGGLGFDLKWNMGWMHDTLRYFARDPVHRVHHHDDLTFGLLYAFSEQFVLPLSHDEVVHGKGSLLNRMPGDRWQRFANLRALYAHMWAHPGKKLLFMGGEIAQENEWQHEHSLDWHLTGDPFHGGVQALVRDLNRIYREQPALHEIDFRPEGFAWIVADDAANNVLAYARRPETQGASPLVCIVNLSPVPRRPYALGMPRGGRWREVLNTDAEIYGGSGMGNAGVVVADGPPMHGQPASATVVVPPLAVVWLVPEA